VDDAFSSSGLTTSPPPNFGDNQNGLRLERVVGFGIIGVRVIAGQTEDQGRHTKRECDLSGGGVFAFHKLHVGWGEAHRFPIEAAFQQHRATRVDRASVLGFELLFDAFVLVGGEGTGVRAAIDDRAGGSRRVVEQGFVPPTGGVVDIDGYGGGLERAETIMVIEGVERLDVEDRGAVFGLSETDGLVANAILEAFRPTRRAGDHPHSVRAEGVEFARGAVGGGWNGFEIGVARDLQVTVERLHQRAAILCWVGALQQRERGVLGLGAALIADDELRRGGGLGDQAHAAVSDGVRDIGLPREAGDVARRPDRTACAMERGDGPRGGGFGLRGTAEEREHGCALLGGMGMGCGTACNVNSRQLRIFRRS